MSLGAEGMRSSPRPVALICWALVPRSITLRIRLNFIIFFYMIYSLDKFLKRSNYQKFRGYLTRWAASNAEIPKWFYSPSVELGLWTIVVSLWRVWTLQLSVTCRELAVWGGNDGDERRPSPQEQRPRWPPWCTDMLAGEMQPCIWIFQFSSLPTIDKKIISVQLHCTAERINSSIRLLPT
jgi:fatty acid desaturase